MQGDQKTQRFSATLIPSEWAEALQRLIEEARDSLDVTYRHDAALRIALSELEPPSRRERAAAWLLARRETLGKRIAPTLLTREEASDAYGDW